MITNKELLKSWLHELLAIVERTNDENVEATRQIKNGDTTIISVHIIQN